MAVFANVRRQRVIRIFSGCVCAVVTANTIANDVGVVKVGRCPCHGCMAIIAIVATVYMRRVLADRDRTVVAGRADANDLCVINRNHRLEERRAMTVFADIACQNMILVFADCVRTVVAANAVGGVVCMIKRRRHPAVGCMAGVAVVTAGNMGRVLTESNRAVVAGRTRTDYLCVVHNVSGRKQDGIVAVLTKIAGEYVIKVFADRVCAIVATEAISRNIVVIEIRR